MFTMMFVAVAGFLGSPADAEPAQAVPPPIEAGEVYVETADGCGVILAPAELAGGATEKYAQRVWYGRCVDGLVDGEGQVAVPGDKITLQKALFVLGRTVWPAKSHDPEKRLTTYRSGDQWVKVYDGPAPFGPRWGYDTETLYSPDMAISIGTHRDTCRWNIELTKKFGCSDSNNYRAFTFNVNSPGHIRKVACPDPRTPVGCDKLWMIEGKPVFESIRAFVAPIEAKLAARRARYQSLITPEWRAQAETKRRAFLAGASAEQLRDMVATEVVAGNLAGAVATHKLLAERFPASPAAGESLLHLTTLYCLQSAPLPALAGPEAAEIKRIFESEPCRRTAIAQQLLFSSNIVLGITAYQVAQDEESAARSAGYAAERRRQRDAYWGSMLGIVAGVVANQVASKAAPPAYSGGTATQPYVAPAPSHGAAGQAYLPPTAISGAAGAGSAAPSAGSPNPGKIPIQAVPTCAQYSLLPNQANYQYFEIRNTCNYGIQVYAKVTESGRWTTYADMAQEIGAYSAAKSRGVLSNDQMLVTIMAVCPSRQTVEYRLQKKITGVYTASGQQFGCWYILENTGVGTAN